MTDKEARPATLSNTLSGADGIASDRTGSLGGRLSAVRTAREHVLYIRERDAGQTGRTASRDP
jgi:hypothetical protein